MAESTQLRDQPLAQTGAQSGESPFERARQKLKLAVTRTIFWSYDRGTWQYDLIVLAILAFIFLTPRSWFRDRPTLELSDLRHHPGIIEVGGGKEGRSYLVDARLVESLVPQKPEEAIRVILRSRVQKPFSVKSTEIIRDKNNVILGYRVVVSE